MIGRVIRGYRAHGQKISVEAVAYAFSAIRLLIFASLILANLGCDKPSASGGVSESREASRIVSLAPSTTEILFAIGAGDRVVGVSRFCDFPPEVAQLPRAGGFTDPSLEAILALSPELVVGSRSPTNRGVVERLSEAGIATWFPPDTSIAEIRSVISGLGSRTGKTEESARVIGQIDRRLEVIAQATKRKDAPRVLLLYGHAPLSGAGPESFGNTLIRAARGENALVSGPAYVTLSIERVIALAPDVIVEVLMEDDPEGFDWSRWTMIPAVAHHRTHILSDARMTRPGPRIGDAAAALATRLYPDVVIP